jgi:outer membrane scaffolding protein for murein synthesis (MipA/OmpV family)
MKFSIKKLFSFSCAIFFLNTAYAQESEKEFKFEVSYGLDRSNQSLINGVLINVRNDPSLNLTYETNKGFASIQNGLGLWFIRNDQLKVGYSLNYLMGRYESSDKRYKGMGDVAGSVAAHLWGEWQPVNDNFTIYGSYSNSLRSANGALAQWGMNLDIPLYKKLSTFVDYSQSFGSKKYLTTYYGVSSGQAGQANDYNIFTPNTSGLLYSNLMFGFNFEAGKKTDLLFGIGTTKASSALMSSPLLDKKSQSTATILINQHFGKD